MISPGIIIQYSVSAHKEVPFFSVSLNKTLFHELLESPARNSIIENLVSGTVAVWILLESGNASSDNAAATTLEKELQRMEQELQLSDEALWAWSSKLIRDAGENTTVHFPVLRVSREEPEEQLFIQMLLRSEPDLLDKKDVPIAFPVYGRGIILYALVGSGINEWTIADACKFIVGPCSCYAKASSPGTELLLRANWAAHIGRTRYDAPASSDGVSNYFEQGEAFTVYPKTDENNRNDLVSRNTGNKEDEVGIIVSDDHFLPWLVISFFSGSAVTALLFFASYALLMNKRPK